MKTFLQAAAASALIAAAAFFAVLAWQAWTLPPRAAADLAGRADRIEAQLCQMRAELAATQKALVSEVAALRVTADTRAASIERTADSRLASVQEEVAHQMSLAISRADSRLEQVAATVEGLRADIKPVLAETQETLNHASGTIAVLRPQILGLVAASKVTAGQTAQAARRFDAEMPKFIDLSQRIGSNFERTTANVERITRPDRWWITAAKIAGPVAGGYVWGKVSKR